MPTFARVSSDRQEVTAPVDEACLRPRRTAGRLAAQLAFFGFWIKEMPEIIIETIIAASAATCYGLIRDQRLRSVGSFMSGKGIDAGLTSGTVEMGQIVSFEEAHFGFRQTLTVKVVEFERGRRFVDEMIKGNFRSFRHTHEFADAGGKTIMRDTLEWISPYGILGRLADNLLLTRRLHKLVMTRNARLRAIAESDI